ncbi:AAA domain-containing protein [Alkalibacterium subtropicum]|uniref:AAA domain-containing protein n=1 Tax=Alkalibacterium subtropicum TaxID=753702 RepID=A0A1I1FEA8_9LACT|nr:AAA family ATPase [Alkalibacterium subtropicum]SFB97614.1 AAA domain-containing protein [Alkalibacterium subtropicum]
MELILIVGPQAVGKMTVGLELEKLIDAELLFNHQTIDLFARFLGYTSDTFQLSEKVRLDLFKAFTSNEETNAAKGIIFTVVAGFDLDNDWKVMESWIELFKHAQGRVYFIELEADLEERLKRNTHEERLSAKPSKRDIAFSRNELLESSRSHRLNSYEGEVEKRLPFVNYIKINNTSLKASQTAKVIHEWMLSVGY